MTPIFDQNTQHVGWFAKGQVFDRQMEWVAFERGGHLFSVATLEWLGPFVEGSLVDRSGQPVGWLLGTQPTGVGAPLGPARQARPARPMRPVKPIAPRRPLFPRHPLRGWSALSWEAWLGHLPADEPAADEGAGSDALEPQPGE